MSYLYWRKFLPQRAIALRRATIFNKKCRQRAMEYLKNHPAQFKVVPKLRRKEFLARNYEDYLVSVALELEGKMEQLPLYPISIFLNSRQLLERYRAELKKVPPECRIQKIGVFDTETTDINGYIVSFAFTIVSIPSFQQELEKYQLLNPEASMSEESRSIHKIEIEELKDKPTFKEISEDFLSLFEKVDMVVGHNVFFDFGVVKRELERIHHYPPVLKVPIFDTMFFSVDLIQLEKRKMPRLEEVVAKFLKKGEEITFHNALEDVKATLEVFKYLMTSNL